MSIVRMIFHLIFFVSIMVMFTITITQKERFGYKDLIATIVALILGIFVFVLDAITHYYLTMAMILVTNFLNAWNVGRIASRLRMNSE
jgi:hypothetical protein